MLFLLVAFLLAFFVVAFFAVDFFFVAVFFFAVFFAAFLAVFFAIRTLHTRSSRHHADRASPPVIVNPSRGNTATRGDSDRQRTPSAIVTQGAATLARVCAASQEESNAIDPRVRASTLERAHALLGIRHHGGVARVAA